MPPVPASAPAAVRQARRFAAAPGCPGRAQSPSRVAHHTSSDSRSAASSESKSSANTRMVLRNRRTATRVVWTTSSPARSWASESMITVHCSARYVPMRSRAVPGLSFMPRSSGSACRDLTPSAQRACPSVRRVGKPHRRRLDRLSARAALSVMFGLEPVAERNHCPDLICPHKATNSGIWPSLGVHSWPCAEKR